MNQGAYMHNFSRLLVIVSLFFSLALAHNTTAEQVSTPSIKQVTSGPSNHFFGYIGHVGNTPWNGDGQYMIVLRTKSQEKMPGPSDVADIMLLDTHNSYAATKIEESRAWNPQQGTMLYWNPDAPETQFFFNDRDPLTNRVFCVLFDISKRKRIKEFRFDDTPIGNGGVAQNGGYYLGLNYGRMDRLRRVTGYGQAFDWTGEIPAPSNDGIFKVNTRTGEKKLLVTFKQLAEHVRPFIPHIDDVHLFINHSLWSRDGKRILFYLRGNWNLKGPRVNEFFTIHADGTNLVRHETFPGGHPEWGEGNTVIGSVENKQVVYNVDTKKIVKELGNKSIFPKPEGDIALSKDGQWFVNGYKSGEENKFIVYNMHDGSHFLTPSIVRGKFKKGDLRLDPSPCWRRDAKALAVPGLAKDGSRQTFVIEF